MSIIHDNPKKHLFSAMTNYDDDIYDQQIDLHSSKGNVIKGWPRSNLVKEHGSPVWCASLGTKAILQFHIFLHIFGLSTFPANFTIYILSWLLLLLVQRDEYSE